MTRRWRRGEGYVAVQAVLIVLLLFGPRTLPGLPPWLGRVTKVPGVTLALLGGGLLAASARRLGPNLTPLPFPKADATLVRTGPYRLVRHPIYAGVLALAFGWALWVHGWLTLFYAALLWVLFEVKAAREERWLSEKFPEYESYRRSVAKFVPFLH